MTRTEFLNELEQRLSVLSECDRKRSLGYFEEEGITIDLTNGGGSDKSMTAVISGQADIGLMGPETGVYIITSKSIQLFYTPFY